MSDRTTTLCETTDEAVPLTSLRADALENWKADHGDWADWVSATGFTAKAGETCPLPGASGGLGRMLVGLGDKPDPVTGDLWTWSLLAESLPEGIYDLESQDAGDEVALGWALSLYRFDRYKTLPKPTARLCWPDGCDRDRVRRMTEAVCLVRDLINTPAADLGPADLADAAAEVARAYGAKVQAIIGGDLLNENYPAIHAVGRAGAQEPRLIDLTWGDETAPKVTLVGKGVCFDSGGLDIKPAEFMKLMKKDMGGAAHVLGLAQLIMDAKLPVRLRVLIPAVENSVSGEAMRPMDVIPTRDGKTVEIGHTDAEGRVVLADALAEASADKPEIIIDCATLTGAARVALGTDLPALFCNDDSLADDLLKAGMAQGDPLWRLPLWDPYRPKIDGKTAMLTNDAEGRYGGAITAALFLREFVGAEIPWIHIDMMAWNGGSRPGRPEGGEAQGLRALFALLEQRYDRAGSR
ncbi:M17 family metallopeptidase [Magnetospira sp. QH-2]|uniref:leucyl aminopeptidase family protein n=1 Tax=Magnetospira sp. (strain QH-2) TaxID=1288970 RepID=UPI0003E816DF|nr:leucyl aminopeptidase family protein [Magnetospira sp. QH-2]CCQ75144.1 Leucine aminopeptidase [Magnetospira sp. QH-2]